MDLSDIVTRYDERLDTDDHRLLVPGERGEPDEGQQVPAQHSVVVEDDEEVGLRGTRVVEPLEGVVTELDVSHLEG